MVIESLSLKVPVPCTVGYFGDKLVTFQTQVKPSEMINLLGHDPRSKNWKHLGAELRSVYEKLQRPTNKVRREGTARYIEDRIAPGSFTLGAFPAISIGVVNPVTFKAYAEQYPAIGLGRGIGTLDFDLSATNPRMVLDGLARITGALDLIDENRPEVGMWFTFPVTIFAPSDKMGKITLGELGQLFHDFNFLQNPVSTGHAVDLDQSNIYIRLTDNLSKAAVIKDNGGMEARAKSLGQKSTALVAKQVLLRFVRGACEGPNFQHTLREYPDNDPKLTRESFDYLSARIARFLAELANRMGERFTDRECLHLTAPGWNSLGVIFHDLEFRLHGKIHPTEETAVFDRLAAIDWSRWNQDWIGLLGDAAIDTTFGGDVTHMEDSSKRKLGKLYGGQQAITKLVDYIRENTGLSKHLAQVEVAPAASPASVA